MPQRDQIETVPARSVWARNTRKRSMLCPAKPSRAGSRVTVAMTITATTTAAPMPMTATIGMPEMARPRMAITTVPPAMITA